MTVLYDEENIIKDLLALFQNNLDDAIDCVNQIKDDSIVLETIPNDMWLFTTLDSSVLNYRGAFICYGFVDTKPSQSQTGNWIENVVSRFEVCVFDDGKRDRSETLFRLIRYRTALKHIINKNPDVFRGYGKPSLKSLEPTAFPYPGTTDLVFSIGLDIECSITGA